MLRWLLAFMIASAVADTIAITYKEPDYLSIDVLPPPISREDVDEVWAHIKKETGAPADFPLPPFQMSWDVPFPARMMFQAPVDEEWIDNKIAIILAPRTIESESDLMVLWGVGHELTHYAFTLKHNGWDLHKRLYDFGPPQHCDPEFQRITDGIADVLWGMYHSETERSKMYAAADMACQKAPEQ